MNVRPLLFLVVILLAGLASLPVADATTYALVQPNPSSVAGLQTDIHRNGQVVTIWHYTTTNGIILSFSADGGVTWSNRATGITPASGAVKMEGMALSATTFRFFYMESTGGLFRPYESTDAGYTWNAMPTDGGLNTYGNGAANSNMVSVQDLGGGKFAYVAFSQPCNNGNHGYVVRYYDGTAYTTVYGVTTFGSSCSNPYLAYCNGVSATVTDALNAVIFTTYGSSNSAPTLRIRVVNGAPQPSITVDDADGPLATRTCWHIQSEGLSGIVLTCSGTPSYVFALRPIGVNTYDSSNTNVLCANAPSRLTEGGSRIAFAVSESSTAVVSMVSSCDGGITWTKYALQGGGTYPAAPSVGYIGGTKVLTAFRYASTLGTIINDNEACTPEGQASGPAQGAGVYSTSSVFCSNIASPPRFDYNFVEQWYKDAGANPAPGSVNRAAKAMTGGYYAEVGQPINGNPDYAYLGAALLPAPAYMVKFRIEAGTDSARSAFRAFFSFVDNTPAFDPDFYSSDGAANHLYNVSAKGNGDTTGFFADGLEVRFWETGDEWNVQMFTHSAGTRAPLNNAFQGGFAGTPNTFLFSLDTRSADPKYAVKYGDGTSMGTGNLERGLTGAAAYAVGENITSQWFQAIGDSTILSDAFTYLDDKSTGGSTCIYGLAGQAGKLGEQGNDGPRSDSTGATEALPNPQAAAAAAAAVTAAASAPRTGIWARTTANWSDEFRIIATLVLMALLSLGAYKLAGPAPMMVGGAATLGMGAGVGLFGFPIWIPALVALSGIATLAAAIAKKVGGKVS